MPAAEALPRGPLSCLLIVIGILILVHELVTSSWPAGPASESAVLHRLGRCSALAQQETEYSSAIPMGRYVKMWEENPLEGALGHLRSRQGLALKPLGRFLIVFAGPG